MLGPMMVDSCVGDRGNGKKILIGELQQGTEMSPLRLHLPVGYVWVCTAGENPPGGTWRSKVSRGDLCSKCSLCDIKAISMLEPMTGNDCVGDRGK